MQARNNQLSVFFNGQIQYCIPIFQRSYSWEKKQAIKLLSDIIAIARDDRRPCHFIGSVIHLPVSQFAAGINPHFVIDGQQRLTTISLLLLALSEYSMSYFSQEDYRNAETRFEQLSELHLVNRFALGEDYYKLKLQSNDFVVYKKLLTHVKQRTDRTEEPVVEFTSSDKLNPVYRNYHCLLDELKTWNLHPSIILKGFYKLLFVDIPLDKEDNAQLVFETVNSTGQKLNESEKITNYILMTVPPEEQDALYSENWKPMVDSLRSAEELDKFIRYYLTIKLERKIGKEYYEQFKDFAQSDSRSTSSIVMEMKQYCAHYQIWKDTSASSTSEIHRTLARIKDTKQDLVIPVVLRVLEHLRIGTCTQKEALSVLCIIESFWMRRLICDLPSNSVSSVCILMLKNLGKAPFVKTFSKALLNVTYAQRMPTDEEIKSKLHEVPIYDLRPDFTRDLLDRIEAYENSDYTHSSNHEIEHIMPQSIQSHEELYARTDLSDAMKRKMDWASDLGADWQQIQKKYLHTLGNLTLTGKDHNIKYKNYRFIEKKTMQDGYATSPIRLTSETLSNLDTWGEKEILTRSDKLAAIICDIWKYPVVE